MRITARVANTAATHALEVSTEGRAQTLAIPPKAGGRGSGVNGGELLFSALATCFCNDLYREAAARRIPIDGVEVEVTGEFGGPGEPARGVTYRVTVDSPADRAVVDDLVRATDAVTEIQNTLRQGCDVRLVTS
jgi:uncharacterized OsmC-like protein